jgi:hypothetical protein
MNKKHKTFSLLLVFFWQPSSDFWGLFLIGENSNQSQDKYPVVYYLWIKDDCRDDYRNKELPMTGLGGKPIQHNGIR